jgi:hypothetical protein
LQSINVLFDVISTPVSFETNTEEILQTFLEKIVEKKNFQDRPKFEVIAIGGTLYPEHRAVTLQNPPAKPTRYIKKIGKYCALTVACSMTWHGQIADNHQLDQ